MDAPAPGDLSWTDRLPPGAVVSQDGDSLSVIVPTGFVVTVRPIPDGPFYQVTVSHPHYGSGIDFLAADRDHALSHLLTLARAYATPFPTAPH